VEVNMGRTLALALLLLAFSLDAQQDEVFSGPQWLATGVYSAARGANRLLFFTAVDCPNRPPAKIGHTGVKGLYLLVWEEPARACHSAFVERSDYESDPAKIIPWVLNQPNSSVFLDSQDRASAKMLTKGDIKVTVQVYDRLAWASADERIAALQTVGFSVSVTPSGHELNALKVAMEDISVSAVAPDLSETRLKITRSGLEDRSFDSFDAAVPASLRSQGFPTLVRIINGENAFLFPFFVPAYTNASQARDKRKQ
jgi:hypothetical protein